MDEEEYVELDDVEEPSSSFPKRNINNTGIPSALANRGMGNKRLSGTSKPLPKPNKNGLNKGLPDKDSGIKNKLKKKSRVKPFGLGKKNSEEEAANNESNATNDNPVDVGSPIDMVVKAKRIILYTKIGLIVVGILAIVAIVMAIVIWIAEIGNTIENFFGLGSTSNLDPTSEYYKEQYDYQKALDKASKKYFSSCNFYLDLNYLHATLSYIGNVSSDSIENEGELYKRMTANVDTVAKLMVKNCVADYEINGIFYNNLKNSEFLRTYYAEQLEYMDADLLVTKIFDYAETGAYLLTLNSGVLSTNINVTLGNCDQPYNKKLLNEGTEYSSTMSFTDYLMSVVHGEVGDYIEEENREYLKAFVIAATSWIIAEVEYKPGMTEFWAHNGECWQAACDINNGCTYIKIGKYITPFSGRVSKPNGISYGYKRPLSDSKRQLLSSILEEVWGTVLVSASTGEYRHGSYLNKCNGRANCFDQTLAVDDAKNGMNYEELLYKYYQDIKIVNIGEDLYASGVSYDNGGYTSSVVNYDQTMYNDKFCGTKATIKTHGCGVTAMASILSTFVDRSLTPPVVMNDAYNMKYCGTDGTNASFFRKEAAKYNLGYQEITKRGNMQEVLDALKTGNSLVIAHMGPRTFTQSGHYIILSKVNENGQVYVLDPNGNRGTGWHDFEKVVAKELKRSFHIITKR